MKTRSAAARAEPASLAEMQARKREADQRQAEAAARFRQASPSGETRSPMPIEPPAETEAQGAVTATVDPIVDAQVRATLGDAAIERTPRRIIARIAEEYGLTYEAVVGAGRDGTLMAARDAALIAVREAHPKRGLKWLGRQFGDRDHTTILHALRRLGVVRPPAANSILVGLRTDAAGLRAIEPLALTGIAPGLIAGTAPTFRLVDPRTLLVDEIYQRTLSEQSLKLIARIVAEWSWRAFKPPIVVEDKRALHVIDGQHTAIGAASHGGIDLIPVMVVEASSRVERAEAFVRHNRDRLQVTGVQMHVSQVVAGDPVAVGVEEACRLAGARILRSNTSVMRYRVGDTIAIEALARLVRRHGVEGAARIIAVCVDGEQAPVRAESLRAVEGLLTGPGHEGVYDPGALAAVLRALAPELPRKVALFAATHRVPRWQAVMAVLAQHTKRRRGAGAAP